jgi:hypothetical protein
MLILVKYVKYVKYVILLHIFLFAASHATPI